MPELISEQTFIAQDRRFCGTGNGSTPSSIPEPHWYVVHTFSRHEKRVGEQLHRRGIEYFLPVYAKLSKWSDRRVRLQLPLFPGYVFVRMPFRERVRVLEVPSVARLITFGGVPAPIADQEIETLRSTVTKHAGFKPHPYVDMGTGSPVRIKSGPFAGLRGTLLRKKAGLRFALSIEMIQRTVVVDIDAGEIEPAPVGIQSRGILSNSF